MKNPFEVLRTKEQELQRVKKEVEALRTIAPLLVDGPEKPPKGKPENGEPIELP
jgi:hypothetical protein